MHKSTFNHLICILISGQISNIQDILKRYWRYDSFRPMQEEIINSVLEKKDTLAVLPTGGGKSICFQVPAMAQEGLCLVISPLIALMKDQVDNLNNKNIAALVIHAGMGYYDVKKTLQHAAFGDVKFLYVSPERLETKLFLEFLPALQVSIIAVDEAHCISQWGYDFRPPYLRIASLRKELQGVPVIALTASATLKVQDDICTRLAFKNESRFQQSFARPNLSYSLFNPPSKQVKLVEILQNVSGSAIVYCKSRRQTQQVAELLRMHKIEAEHYHAGLPNEERSRRQKNWMSNVVRVIVSTNAFGMGIDKPDVRTVVHYDIPDCLENYYQEAGRAGRDGNKAYAVLLYNNIEPEELFKQINLRFPSFDDIKKVYVALMNFLQVPAGNGEFKSYDFDIASFVDHFKLTILEATYGIQALAKEDLLSYNEIFFTPSSIVFTATKTDLADFEKLNPQHEDLIKGLLRSYEGIFDFPVTVHETSISRFIGKPIEEIKKGLADLHSAGIIQYAPQKDTPQIFLLKNRMYTDAFRINTVAHEERKNAYRERVNAMIEFVRNNTTCRALQIGNYFGDKSVTECKVCDNCLSKKSKVLSEKEFENLSEILLQSITPKPLLITEIEKIFVGSRKEKVWQIIEFLIAENKIYTDKEGFVSRKKSG